MKSVSKKDNEYKSIKEFEERFLPDYSRNQLSTDIVDNSDFGVSLAKESLGMIKRQISKTVNK